MGEDPRVDVDDVVTVLDVSTGRGVWAVRSLSRTVYYLDLDAGLVMRARGRGSASFPFDGEWVPLVEVSTRSKSPGVAGSGQVRVGERPKYATPVPTLGAAAAMADLRDQRAKTAGDVATAARGLGGTALVDPAAP